MWIVLAVRALLKDSVPGLASVKLLIVLWTVMSPLALELVTVPRLLNVLLLLTFIVMLLLDANVVLALMLVLAAPPAVPVLVDIVPVPPVEFRLMVPDVA